MSYDTVDLRVADGIAVLTLNRPDVLNALNTALIEDMRAALAEVDRSEQARAIVVTGAGRGFCAGADLIDTTLRPDGDAPLGDQVAASMEAHFNPLIEELAGHRLPTVAAVNGVAAGGGCGVALAADIVVAAKSARFVQVFTPQLGLVPDMGCTWHLPRLIGRARARGMAMLGEPLEADRAAEWGLIWQAVDDDVLMDRAMAIANRLRDGPARAYPLVGAALDAALDNDLGAQLELEREYQRELAGTEDFLEGVAAFAQKRKPAFKGR